MNAYRIHIVDSRSGHTRVKDLSAHSAEDAWFIIEKQGAFDGNGIRIEKPYMVECIEEIEE